MRSRKGFTLIELLVTVAVIALLASVILATLDAARKKSRDTKRKQDMLQMRTAINAYYSDYGSYPLPYGGVMGVLAYSSTNGGVGQWCTTNGLSGAPSGPNAYIQGLTPSYIKQLPTDPTPSNVYGTCSGYVYASNGKDYKFMTFMTPESVITAGSMFYDPQGSMAQPSWMICSGGVTACNNWGD